MSDIAEVNATDFGVPVTTKAQRVRSAPPVWMEAMYADFIKLVKETAIAKNMTKMDMCYNAKKDRQFLENIVRKPHNITLATFCHMASAVKCKIKLTLENLSE